MSTSDAVEREGGIDCGDQRREIAGVADGHDEGEQRASGAPSPSLARTLEITAVNESTTFDFTVEIAHAQMPPNTAATLAAVNDRSRLPPARWTGSRTPRAVKLSALKVEAPVNCR